MRVGLGAHIEIYMWSIMAERADALSHHSSWVHRKVWYAYTCTPHACVAFGSLPLDIRPVLEVNL